VITSQEGETKLQLKQLTPVRLLKNAFSQEVEAAEARGADTEELTRLLGRARAKKGMFEGDMEQGELEIGQVAAFIRQIKPAGEIVREVWQEFLESGRGLCDTIGAAGN
jgi:enoyl-[acyl-carrier protein] reductase II